ncbi:MAG: hypothetical protein ACYS26_17140 [Planctomycetota bacterium]|jgi:hypothetical protein
MNDVHTPGPSASQAMPTESGGIPTTLESNFDPIEFFAPPPARGHWMSLAGGFALAGLGAATGAVSAGLVSAPGQVSWMLSQAAALGVTPALTAVSGMLLFGVGLAQRQSVRATQRLHDELARQPSPIPFLEEVDFQQQNLHVNLVHVENRVRETLNEVLVPIHQDLQQVLGAQRGGAGDGQQEALWRLAASLDQVGARLEQFVGQRMSELGEEISSELAESTASLAETLKQPLEDLRSTRVESAPAAQEAEHGAQHDALYGEPQAPPSHPEPPSALPSSQGAPEPARAAAPEVTHAVGAKPLEQRDLEGSVDHLGLLDELDPPTTERSEKSGGGYNPYEDAPRHPWSGSSGSTSEGGSIFDSQIDGDEGPLNMRSNDLR